MPNEAKALEGDILKRRKVWLQNARGERLGYAVSWWPTEDYDRIMGKPKEPIGRQLANAKTEFFREIHSVFCGVNKALASQFGAADDQIMWGRHYTMWRGGKPLNVIVEIFSPYLTKYLGPIQGDGGTAATAAV